MMEVCDNGLDDDGDGRIDIFDPDCQCTITPPPNLVPNGTFTETDGCCADLGVFNCLQNWIVLGPSPDYISDNCRNSNLRPDVRFLTDQLNDDFNEGYAFSVMNTTDDRQFTESLGVCLTEPMEADKTYEVSFDLANLRNDSPNIPFTLLGIDRCDRLDEYDTRGNNSYCKQGLDFTRLGTVNAQELSQGWNTFTFDISPSENIEAILYSVDCAFNPNNPSATFYMVIDNVSIREKINAPAAPAIDSTGQICQESVRLSVAFDADLTYQWYKDSTLIIGATDTLFALPQTPFSPAGVYHVVVRDAEQNCALSAPFFLNPPASLSRLDTSICTGEVYIFGGQQLTMPGIYQDTLSSAWGCDSIVELNLSFLEGTTTNVAQQICFGDSVSFGGASLSASGIYLDTLLNAQGCDSIIALELHVWEESVTPLTVTACVGETYFFGGQALSATGVYKDTLTNAIGCDSVLVLDFRVLAGDTTTVSASICPGESYPFGTNSLTSAGVYQNLLFNAQGCDSLVLLNLTVLPSPRSSQAATICAGDSYTFAGTSLMEAGDYQDTLSTVAGCDSIVELQLAVLDPVQSNLSVSICEGESYFFAGVERVNAGVYQDTLGTIQGCDSIIRLDLSVRSSVMGDTLVIRQALGTEFLFAGNAYSSAGFYQAVLLGANGCDSTAYLSLSFFDPCESALQIDADLFDPTCEIAENGAMELIGVGDFPPFQYALESGPFQFNPRFTDLGEGEYTVKVLDSFGCLATASFSLLATESSLQVEAGPDTSILLGNSVLLRLQEINFSAVSYRWMLGQEEICTDCQEWLIRPASTTVYTLQVVDEFGCFASDEVQVKVVLPPDFFIPNAFSPNDDGVNDVFRVESTPDGLSRIERMMIYSRWGDLLYEGAAGADAASLAWDGMVNGKRVEQGIYVYCIHWQKPDGEKALFSGDLLLIR